MPGRGDGAMVVSGARFSTLATPATMDAMEPTLTIGSQLKNRRRASCVVGAVGADKHYP
jgi:hypothetical protein